MTPTRFDPTMMLGCSAKEAQTLLEGRLVTPGEVEAVALRSYPWRRYLRDSESYWITTSQAAEILHLSVPQVRHLLQERKLPYATHRSGVRLMRREEIQAIAQTRVPQPG
jgi:excisionase family DNA binding protein